MISGCLRRLYMWAVIGAYCSVRNCCRFTRNPSGRLKENATEDSGGVMDALQFFKYHTAEFELVHAEAAGKGGSGGRVEEMNVHCWHEERWAVRDKFYVRWVRKKSTVI